MDARFIIGSISLNGREYQGRPKVMYVLNSKKEFVRQLILQADPVELREHWEEAYIHEGDERLRQWTNLVATQSDVEMSLLYDMFEV